MEAPAEARDSTFTLQVLSHSVGSTQTLTFAGLPTTTTVAQLKTKIKERLTNADADEEAQRLIHHGRILMRAEQTMAEVFGLDTLKSFPTQSLHLSIRPRMDERQEGAPVPTPTTPLPSNPGQSAVASGVEAGAPPVMQANDLRQRGFPTAWTPVQTEQESAEQQRLEELNHTSALSEAARAYATQRLDINSLHHANNHAVDASIHLQNMQALDAPLSIRETARTGLQVALEHQFQAWQRAYLTSIQNERHILSQPGGTAADTMLRHAIRMGIEYLEAEDRLASSPPGLDPPSQEASKMQRDHALQRYQLAVGHANAIIGLPHASMPISGLPRQRLPQIMRGRRRGDAAAPAAAAAAAEPEAEALPVLGHGPNVRPLAAGMLAVVVPHLWNIFKLAIFIYAFTSLDDSWLRIATIFSVALVMFLYNIGALDGFWTAVTRHLQDLLPMADVPLPPPRDQAQAQPPAAGATPRRRRTEPTPEQYAQRLRARQQLEARDRAQAGRSWLHNTLRMVEHDVLLFLFSIIPGVAERHIAARNSEVRARERERAREETAGEEQEARDDDDVQEREQREAAVVAAAVEGARQEAEEQRFGAGQRLGGGQQPRPAAVEDEVFGGVD